MNPTELRLLNDFQRDFPLCSTPFAAVAAQLDTTEETVLALLREFSASGAVSRVGPVFRPHSIGVSTLAALAVPENRLAAVAALVNRFPEINHNYEREHSFNLWFVATAPDERRLHSVLDAICIQTACTLISLPLLESYHLDLGFDLRRGRRAEPVHSAAPYRGTPVRLNPAERRLVAALQAGLPLVPRPYRAITERIRYDEGQVIATIEHWLDAGIIKRFGIIVRHRELGFTANAMTVWDVPDELIAEYGRRLSLQDGVNLCYRRSRCPPAWAYNLFCMIHGRSRAAVLAHITAIEGACGLGGFPRAVLFSRRRFKQRGATYVTDPA